MSAGHTQGPWSNADGRIYSERYVLTGAPIATVHKRKGAGQYEANAHLIAAAPDLLEALKGILAVASVRIDDPRIAQWDAARSAIAKATGEVA